MKKQNILILSALCGLAFTAQAQWALIDDFESGEFPLAPAVPDGWKLWSMADAHEPQILDDPKEENNKAFYMESGAAGISWSDVFFSRPFPAGSEIQPGESATMYYRFLLSGYSNSWHVGVTHVAPPVYDEATGYFTAPQGWGAFNTLVRLSTLGSLEHRAGGTYVATNPAYIFEIMEWYEFWHYIDNSFDGTTSTGYQRIYIKGPNDTAPVLIPVGTEPPTENAPFRTAAVNAEVPAPIHSLYLATNSGNPGNPFLNDPWLMDDFYIASGLTLTDPRDGGSSSTWGPWDIVANGDVNTEGWMGWLNVTFKPWIWSYARDGWVYAEEPNASGGWVYMMK